MTAFSPQNSFFSAAVFNVDSEIRSFEIYQARFALAFYLFSLADAELLVHVPADHASAEVGLYARFGLKLGRKFRAKRENNPNRKRNETHETSRARQ